MSGKSTGFHDVMGTMCTAAENSGTRSGLAMLDGTDSAARLRFTSSGRRRRTAVLDRWLAVVRVCPAAGRAARMVWVLDARTTRWSGGSPPGDLHRGMTGLDAEAAPMLWFRADDGAEQRRGFTAAGVFGAAGIVDAARVRVTGRRIGKHVRLRMTIDTRMWGLSASPGEGDVITAAAGPALSIRASGVLRPLEFAAVRRWL
jgi:hypothetical protein